MEDRLALGEVSELRLLLLDSTRFAGDCPSGHQVVFGLSTSRRIWAKGGRLANLGCPWFLDYRKACDCGRDLTGEI